MRDQGSGLREGALLIAEPRALTCFLAVMPKISSHAVVDPNARLAEDVQVGPFCVIGPDVILGAGCQLLSHVAIGGHTTIGRDNIFHPFCNIGGTPQDLKYRGAPTRLEIGNGNVIRENVTLHIGTEKGGGLTRIGDQNLLMVNAHVGHDAHLGNRCIVSNNVMIAGHVSIGDFVAMMGGVGVHHFVTIGDFAYIGGYAQVHHDVPPFVKMSDCDQIRGLNSIGLKRAGFSDADIDALESATRRLFYSREKPFSTVLSDFDTQNGINPHVKRMVEFLRRRDTGRHGRYLESMRQA
jgi:UDP-N-acetylglucosamine acyltransferase